MRGISMLWRNLRHRSRIEKDLDDELQASFDLLVDEMVAQGVSPADARRSARLQLGSAESLKEEVRDVWQGAALDVLVQDFRYALRRLRRSPGFAIVASLTLALGVGVNTAVFGIFNEAFLRPAPHVEAPERLVRLRRTLDFTGYRDFGHLQYKQYAEQVRTLSSLSAERGASIVWRDRDQARELQGKLVSANYFRVLGVWLAAGRDFEPDEERTPGAGPVAIVSDALWRGALGGDAGIVGRRLHLGEAEFAVIGVAPPRFRGVELAENTDVWLPLSMEAATHAPLPTWNSDLFPILAVTGRLRSGASVRQVEAELGELASRIEQEHRIDGRQWRVAVMPDIRLPDSEERGSAATLLTLLSATSALVLLIVCANLASLVLARGVVQRPEIAMRLALGAGRFRVVRQLVVENIALTLPGAAGGVLVSLAISLALSASDTIATIDLSPDLGVLGFAVGLALLTSVAFGLFPAMELSRPDLASPLRTSDSRSWGPRLRTLVSAQMALSLMLLAGAGLFLRTLQNMRTVDVGFEADQLLQASFDLERAGYTDARARAFYERLTDRISGRPGVSGVSRASSVPVNRGFVNGPRQIVAESTAPGWTGPRVAVEHNDVSDRYLSTVGIGLLRGRAFSPDDSPSSPGVAIVSEVLARRVWPGHDPIGQRIRFEVFMGLSDPVEVVGVMRGARVAALDPTLPPEVLVPLSQNFQRNQSLIVRAASMEHVQGLAAAIRGEARLLDPGLPPVTVHTARQWLGARLDEQRLIAGLISAFGAIALLLAALGLAGTQWFEVSQRTREIGVRMALGATNGSILGAVLKRTLIVALSGIVVGLLASLALTGLIAKYLFGVTPNDPSTFGIAVIVLLAVAVLASWFPARRAIGVDPMLALRHE